MSGDDVLDVRRLRALLAELSESLRARGEHAVLFVVGGAAMVLAYDAHRSTRDVDALFRPAVAVREVVGEVAARDRLQPDWVNDAVKGFLPGDDECPRTVFESENLLVQVPSPEYLMAMKIFSGRDDRDLDDAARLFRLSGMSTAEQAIELVGRTYPEHLLLPRHRYICFEVAARASRAVEEDRLLERVRRIHDMAVPDQGAAHSARASEECPPRGAQHPQQHHAPRR